MQVEQVSLPRSLVPRAIIFFPLLFSLFPLPALCNLAYFHNLHAIIGECAVSSSHQELSALRWWNP